MTYEGRKQVEVGSRENSADCKKFEHYVGACYLLWSVARPWWKMVAPRHSSEGGMSSPREDSEVFVDQKLPRDLV